MTVEQLMQSVPAFVLVFFRVAGMMIYAPLFGSGRVPRRVRLLLAVVLAVGLVPVVPNVTLPTATWELAAGITGELVFGLSMGLILSFIFIAAQWAGEMIGQQMGLTLGEVFDPQFGGGGSIVGDFYFMLTLVVFLTAGGHRAMLMGVHQSFVVLPLMGVGMSQGLFDILVGLFQSCAVLALRLAGPIFVTMLVVDVALGFISKTMPQINIMSAGLSLRSVLGMAVLLIGMSVTSDVLCESMFDAMNRVALAWTDSLLRT